MEYRFSGGRGRARAGAGTAGRRSFALALWICALLATPLAQAANPQPYRVHWVSSGRDAVDSTLKETSQL